MRAVFDQAERLRQASPAWMESRMRECGFTSGMSAAEGDEAGQRLVEMAGREYRMRESAAQTLDMRSRAKRSAGYRLPTPPADDSMMAFLAEEGIPMRTREAVYGGENGTSEVFYEDANTWQDVTDLFSVLDQELENGTPNLENSQVEALATAMQEGRPLSDVQIGVLRGLLDKYSAELAAFRASGRSGQDYADVPDPATARLAESAAGGLIDLFAEEPPPAPGPDGLYDLSLDGIPTVPVVEREAEASRLRETAYEPEEGLHDLRESGVPMVGSVPRKPTAEILAEADELARLEETL